MAYLDINRTRFEYLLLFGTDDDELRRFFASNRAKLILKGGKVQNLPRGASARIAAMLNLPRSADVIVQEWFSKNLTMIDPEPVKELVETYQLYEEEEEGLSDSDAKRLSRSCLIHLFADDPSEELLEFLRSPIGGDVRPDSAASGGGEETVEQESVVAGIGSVEIRDLASAMIALLEGKDPDEYLSGLPLEIGSLISGLYAIKAGHLDEASVALEDLVKYSQVGPIFEEYERRLAKAKEAARDTATGIQVIRVEEGDGTEFDFDKDQVVGICTKDSPETAVFIRPFAMRDQDGRLLSLQQQDTREILFPNSGDVQAFTGQFYPRQPKKGEIGIWHIAPNEPYDPKLHRTNFHLSSAKTDVYEVRLVPFSSTDFESVREYIKEQMNRVGKKQREPLLFALRDGLIVGCPSGKDLTKDEGFDDGLLSWNALNAFRFEGRMLVLGPLPVHEKYECATLALTLKRFLSRKRSESQVITKTQMKYLIESVSSGEAHLNAARRERLLEELKYIDQEDGSMELLVGEAMNDERILARIESAIEERVNEQTGKRNDLSREIAQLTKQRDQLKESIGKQKREQRIVPSAVSKAVKGSLKKAREDVFGTLGEVLVFRALMSDRDVALGSRADTSRGFLPIHVRKVEQTEKPFFETLTSLGLSSRHARALEATGEVVCGAGLILVVEGVAARVAAEEWGRTNGPGCVLVDCEVGITGDEAMKDIAAEAERSIVILDANLSPPDVYARPLIDGVQRRLMTSEKMGLPRVVMSLSDGVASLPLPNAVSAVAVHISLDRKPEFIRESDAVDRLEEVKEEAGQATWASQLWKPALTELLQCLEKIRGEELALVMSVLDGSQG